MSDTVQQVILAILKEARDANQRLTTTYLVKYLYLLDVLVARENGGQDTWTGLPWKFFHFGPWCADAMTTVDALAAKGFVESQEGTNKRGDKDYRLYWLAREWTGPSLEAFGVPHRVRSDLARLVRGFVGDLSGLLHFVYFATEPMKDRERKGR